MKKMTAVQAAYIAGFMEGEGSFFISKRRKGSLSGRLSPHISVGQKKPGVLVYLQGIVGIGYVHYISRSSGFNRDPYYRYTITGHRSIKDFVRAIYSHLRSPRTRKRAWCVYQMAKLINPSGKHFTKKQYEARMKIYKIWEVTRTQKTQKRLGI